MVHMCVSENSNTIGKRAWDELGCIEGDLVAGALSVVLMSSPARKTLGFTPLFLRFSAIMFHGRAPSIWLCLKIL